MAKSKTVDRSKVNQFKARLSIILREKGWSYADLAKAVGKSRQSLRYTVEGGNPKTSTLRLLAAALDVGMDVLLTDVSVEEYGEAFLPVSK